MSTPGQPPLGKPTDNPDRYDAGLLCPIPRAAQREALGFARALPFSGADLWTAYELSWLDARGKPEVAIGLFRVPAESPNLVESKSMKLYLNGFSQTPVDAPASVEQTIAADLARACGSPVEVSLARPDAFSRQPIAELEGELIDGLEIDVNDYTLRPDLLAAGGDAVEETLVSNLFKSNCPLTGQPDWASVQVRYRGPRIDRAGLLRYIVSFRRHGDFHEHCVERMFVDILHRCQPRWLTVYARFTRRGGLDINPFRSNSEPAPAASVRTARQ